MEWEIIPRKKMKNYKAKGHQVFAGRKNPFVLPTPRVSRHGGKRKGTLKSTWFLPTANQGHTGKRKGTLKSTWFLPTANQGHTGKRKGTLKSTWFLPTASQGHTGKRKGKLTSTWFLPTASQGHTGKRKGKLTSTWFLPTASQFPGQNYSSYQPKGKKFRIKTQGQGNSSTVYRSSKKHNRHKVKQKVLAQVGYQGGRGKYHKSFLPAPAKKGYAGSNSRKHKVKRHFATTAGYQGGNNKRHKATLPGVPQKGYGGSNAHRHNSGVPGLSIQRYRSGATGKKYKVKKKPLPMEYYRSGAGGKKHRKAVGVPVNLPYHSGNLRKKSGKSPLRVPSLAYTGGGKKRRKEVKVVVSVPYRSGSMSGNSPKKEIRIAGKKPYRKGNQVHRYKVKSRKKAKETPRKHNATAARTKKLAYLEKNIKGKKRRFSENGDYHGHITFNQFLRLIIVVLSILVGISLLILVETKDEWLNSSWENPSNLTFSEKCNKNSLENVKEL